VKEKSSGLCVPNGEPIVISPGLTHALQDDSRSKAWPFNCRLTVARLAGACVAGFPLRVANGRPMCEWCEPGRLPVFPHEYLELAAAGSRLKYRWSTVPTSRQIYFWPTDLTTVA
jgi:hypothetical protein